MKKTKPARLQFDPAKYQYRYRVTEGKIGGVTFTHISCPELGKFKPIEMAREQALKTNVVTGLLYRHAQRRQAEAISRIPLPDAPRGPLPHATQRAGGYRTWKPSFIQCARLFLCDVLTTLSPEEFFQWQTKSLRGGNQRYCTVPVPGKLGDIAKINRLKAEIASGGFFIPLDVLVECLEQLGYQATIVDPTP